MITALVLLIHLKGGLVTTQTTIIHKPIVCELVKPLIVSTFEKRLQFSDKWYDVEKIEGQCVTFGQSNHV